MILRAMLALSSLMLVCIGVAMVLHNHDTMSAYFIWFCAFIAFLGSVADAHSHSR